MKKLFRVYYQGEVEVEAFDEEDAKREAELLVDLYGASFDVYPVQTCSETQEAEG